MIVLYNSEGFAVMQVDLPGDASPLDGAVVGGRSGYEIVDKASRKGIFLDGDMAAGFRASVEALTQQTQDTDDIDAYLSHYTGGVLQPMVLH